MIPIEQKNLQEIEYLLTQSVQGVHLLFDNKTIAKVLKKPTEKIDFFNYSNVSKIQNLFTELVNKKSLAEKRLFLQQLKPKEYELLLRTYFHILENTILASSEHKH